jgi:SAM-dependent methyltransferase
MPSNRDGFLTKLQRVRFSVESVGLGRTVADVLTHLLAYRPDRDDTFDRAFHTDTAGSVAPSELGIADALVREQAILYLPSPARVTRWMLDRLGIDHRTFSFVDLGCGKGRVLLVASEYPFQRVIGVEISAQLSEIARSNVEKYRPRARRCSNVDVQAIDATTVDFPDTDLVVHLYHPFEAAITSAVLSRLETSFRSKPRKVVVAYLLYAKAFESVEAVFAQFPWLVRRRYERSVLGQYNWLVYSAE